ncbi:hypothetical protein APU90_09645 [Rathayibacter toxicus]|nr:hypothetical protein APU90_09645 [Rathayibacter toxicus]
MGEHADCRRDEQPAQEAACSSPIGEMTHSDTGEKPAERGDRHPDSDLRHSHLLDRDEVDRAESSKQPEAHRLHDDGDCQRSGHSGCTLCLPRHHGQLRPRRTRSDGNF